MSIPYTITDLTATVYIDGEPFVVDRTTQTFTKLVEILSGGDVDHVQKSRIKALMVNYGAELETIRKENEGKVTITRREVLYNGQPINAALARRVLDISQSGLPIDPWIAFVENLYSNPAEHAREEMYLWLEQADLPITDDGHFLAYKRVSSDFKDLHTRTFDNSPGTVVTMPGGRPAVDSRRDNVCSTGLHFCSKDYLPNFGSDHSDTVVLVKINPADVVSIPSDYKNTKGRTWRYEVLSVVEDYATKEWAPLTAEDGKEWYRKDPFGNLIQDDPYSVEPLPEDIKGEVLEDKYGGRYTLGIYPEDVKAHVSRPEWFSAVYEDRIGDAVRLYTSGLWDFDHDDDDEDDLDW